MLEFGKRAYRPKDEKPQEPQDLSISRPQNPEQYSDRLICIWELIYNLLGYLESLLLRYFFSDENSLSILFYCFYFLYCWKKRRWVERGLEAFVHMAWMATYRPDWDPNGRWKWFWKVSNWEPPVPFKTMMKWYLKVMFSLSFTFGFWSGVAMVTLYWILLCDKKESLGMYVTSLVGKVVMGMVFEHKFEDNHGWDAESLLCSPAMMGRVAKDSLSLVRNNK